MSRFIVVAPGSSEAAALATDELARVLGVATVDALAGTTATDAALRPASALPAAVEAVRAAGDDALIAPAREASNRAFDHVAWNLNLAASTRAGVVLAFDAEGASAELLAEEIAAARLRAKAAAASVVAVVLTGGAPALQADVPVLTLPLGDEAAATLRATAAPTAVTPLAFQADLIERARAQRKRIVLPEPDDDRVLQAAAQVLAAGIADITFVGDADYVAKRAGELGLDLSAAQVVSVNDPAYLERYAEEFARLRAKKGVTLEQAREKVTDVSYFGTMMVHMGDAVTSARTAAQFGVTPRVAMLSYSTGTSGSGPDVDVVVEATRLAREKAPELAIEGPIQFDAAVDEAVAATKLPGSEVAGKATVFVFPSLEAGNIGYKAVQRSSGALAVGPVLQGLNKPVNDLSRGALVEDIVNTVALTAVQAQG